MLDSDARVAESGALAGDVPVKFAIAAALALLSNAAMAQLLLSANDNKVLLENGRVRVLREPKPDTLSLIDIGATPPVVKAEIPVPASVVGPPSAVAITPDERLALVVASQRPDPAEPGKLIAGNGLTVVDLTATPPKVIATLPTGQGPASITLNRAGTLALVANRMEGTINIFRVAGTTVTPVGKLDAGTLGSELAAVVFTPDGKRALVTRQGDHLISVLAIDGEKVSKLDREMTAGVRPYGVAVAPDGKYALVANQGRNTGDSDTVSLIDLTREPWRVGDTVSVGQSPEGIAISPDSRFAAVTVINGSNQPNASPFYGTSQVKILRIENGRAQLVSEAQVGPWTQGVAFAPDGRRIFVGTMGERNIHVFALSEDGKLTETGPPITLAGGSASLKMSEKPR